MPTATQQAPSKPLRSTADRPLSVYALMPDDVLDSAIVNLERVTSQHAFTYAAPRTRTGYLDALDAARAEAERRAAA